METIKVGYHRVGPVNVGWHKFLIYTNSKGLSFTIRGGPAGDGELSSDSAIASVTDAFNGLSM